MYETLYHTSKYFLRPEKVHFLFKNYFKYLIEVTFYPNKQIWPNKLIKLKLSNHDNTGKKNVWSNVIFEPTKMPPVKDVFK